MTTIINTPSVLRDKRTKILEAISVLYDLPDTSYDIIDDDELFQSIVQTVRCFQRLITRKVLNQDRIDLVIYDFEVAISYLIENTIDTEILSVLLKYVHTKLDVAFQMTIDLDCLESAENIRKFNLRQ